MEFSAEKSDSFSNRLVCEPSLRQTLRLSRIPGTNSPGLSICRKTSNLVKGDQSSSENAAKGRHENDLSKNDPDIQLKKKKFADRLEKEGSKDIIGRTTMGFRLLLAFLFVLLELMLVPNPQDMYRITNSTINATLPWEEGPAGEAFTFQDHWVNDWTESIDKGWVNFAPPQ
jgi:hypothetical protein